MQSKLVVFLKSYGALILILLVAVFFRFNNLGSNPPGLYPDEAANGLDVIRMIDNHDFRVSYDTNGPREALFLYLQGIFVFLGHTLNWAALNFTPLSLRIAPAIIGVVTVFAVYLLGKELANKNVGLFAAAALAVSSWHVQFSRNGFRAIMAPLMLTLMFYYFLKAYRNEKTRDFVLTGVWFALGFYTYFAFRLIPLALLALIVFVLIVNRDFYKRNLQNILWMLAGFIITMVPMFFHFFHVPGDILGRSSTSIFNPELNNGSPLLTLGSNIFKTITMFNFWGDQNWRHNVGGFGMLDALTGLLLWIGVAVSLWNWKKIEHFMLITWFGAMTLPMILTAEGIPHALRAVGTIPVVFLWVAIGLEFITSRLKLREAAGVGVLVLLLTSGAMTYHRYFVLFPKAVEAGNAYTEDMVSIAEDINSAPRERRNIIVAGEFGTKTIEFITRKTVTNPGELRFEQYETREIKDIELDESEYVKIFVQENWISETNEEFRKRGLSFAFVPVKSQHNGETIYYAYPHVDIKIEYAD